MCHSVEMYLPGLTHDAAEAAFGARRAPRGAGLVMPVVAAVARGGRRLARALPALPRFAVLAPALAALLLLAGCAAERQTAPPPETHARVPAPIANNDTNVYAFEHIGPNRLGTLAVTAHPTAGPNAAPAGSLAGEAGRAKAEAAVAAYGSNEFCDGAPFRLAAESTSRYDPAKNAWTVFGRCA